jgi:hypothetical protein
MSYKRKKGKVIKRDAKFDLLLPFVTIAAATMPGRFGTATIVNSASF